MRIADRYIGWQVLYGTIFGVTLLTVVLVLGQLFKQIRPLLVEQAAPLDLIGRFVLLILPFSLMFTLPWGFLASTLLSFGRLSSHNELLGLRMAGLSLTRVAFPVLVIGVALSAACSWLTGTAAPNAKSASRDLLYDAVKRDPRALLDPGVVQSRFDKMRVYVEHRDEAGVLHGVHIYELSDDSRDAKPVRYYFAETADLYVDTEKKQLCLKLTDTYVERDVEGEPPDMLLAGELQPVLIDFSATDRKRNKPSDITNAEIPGSIRASEAEEARLLVELAQPGLNEKEVEDLEYAVDKERRRQKELLVQLHKRRSLSVACLAFAVIGIPLGVTARRKETSNGLLLSLLVAAGYFGLLIFAEQIEDSPLPQIVTTLWLPNVACLVLGVWLFRRASHR